MKPQKIGSMDDIEMQNTSKDDGHIPISIQQRDMQLQPLFTLWSLPKRIVAITIMLTIMGLTFFILGVYFCCLQPSNYKQYLPLIFIGSLMLIPGVYYCLKLYQFVGSRTRAEQEQIIQDLPIDY